MMVAYDVIKVSIFPFFLRLWIHYAIPFKVFVSFLENIKKEEQNAWNNMAEINQICSGIYLACEVAKLEIKLLTL